MNDWIRKNGLQLALLAAGVLLAWGAINARVSAVELKISQYPSQDWFELKFETMEKSIANLETLLVEHKNEDKEVKK